MSVNAVPGRDAAVGIALGGVVDEPARLADPLLDGLGGAHPRQPSIGPCMEVEGPTTGEQLNPGPPTEPRQAASVIVLRGGADGLEVLLLRRNPDARFMGGAWVFPGGAVDGDESHRVAAVREVEEEAGLRLPDPAALVRFSRWITPPQITTRFDTHFFLATAPPGQEPRADGEEMVDLGWHTPGGCARRAPPRRARARLPHDQAPRAARGVPLGDRAARVGDGPRGRRRRAAGADHGRDRARGAAGRTRLLARSSRSSAAPTTDSASIWWCS